MKPLTYRHCLIKARKYKRVATSIPESLADRVEWANKAAQYKSLAIAKATTQAEKAKAEAL
jgi:hypothetical protein